jgi:hypothetical protein
MGQIGCGLVEMSQTQGPSRVCLAVLLAHTATYIVIHTVAYNVLLGTARGLYSFHVRFMESDHGL